MAAPLFKHRRTTLERAEKFTSKDYFTDVNLRSRVYKNRTRVLGIFHHAARGRIPFREAVTQEFTPAKVGSLYGPTWATHWFRLEFIIPEDWKAEDAVCLQWDSGSEALVWSCDGVPLQGLNKDHRPDFILGTDFKLMTGKITLYVEMACNTLFGAGEHMIWPPDPDKTFTLSKCDLVTVDPLVNEVIIDIELLTDIAKELPEDDQRSSQALHAVNHMVTLCTLDQRDGLRRAREVAQNFYRQRNGDSQFTVHAIGNAHIDTAWLWPYAETVRKCARTWSTALRMMEKYPDYIFACSQAQQLAWVKESYPALFEKIKAQVAEGRFIIVGGTWVEMDGNIPSGEAMARQLIHGQKFFMEEFGVKCTEFWLPDTFGYSAQLPQLMTGAGMTRFLSIKISWSLVNKFPHSTFWWEGIDGTRCLSHFPPADHYGCTLDMKQVLKTRDGNKDKGRTNHGIMLYGYSDGGGGPDEKMLERIRRLHDTDGVPKIQNSTPNKFFQQVEASELPNLCTWVGELYLELHQGTLTSQGKIKNWNRKLEISLQTVEKLYSILSILHPKGPSYPHQQLDRAWKQVLLNQFHDVLPGSCIQEVVKDACAIYEEVDREVTTFLETGLAALSSGIWSRKWKADDTTLVVFNPHPWERSELISIPREKVEQFGWELSGVKRRQDGENRSILVHVKAPAFGLGRVSESSFMRIYDESFQARTSGERVILENAHLRAEVDSCGRVRSLLHKKSGLDAFLDDPEKGFHGNQFVLYDDIPLFWDAWDVMDYHLETRQPLIQPKASLGAYVTHGPLRKTYRVQIPISDKSWLQQEISLDLDKPFLLFKTKIHWHESHKMLKVEFPFNVHSTEATYEIQFGHLKRPTHRNTTWDWAKHEVVGQKWADMSQHGWGVSLLNDCKYGHSTEGNVMRLSLLRSPKSPDPNCDMGVHDISYAVYPHSGSFQDAGIIQAAYDFNNPLMVWNGQVTEPLSVFRVDNPAVVIETVKLPEYPDKHPPGTLVMRFYEAYGSHAKGILTTSFKIKRVARCNLLEEEEYVAVNQDHSFLLTMTAFQIQTFLVQVEK